MGDKLQPGISGGFYGRRCHSLPIEFPERRKGERRSDQRRHQERIGSLERRRLSSQIRRSERTALNILLHLRCYGRGFPGHTRDLGPCGLSLITNAKLSRGMKMTLNFLFTDACHLELVGEVSFSRPLKEGKLGNIYGVKFLRINNLADKILRSAIHELRLNPGLQSKSSLEIVIDNTAPKNGVAPFRGLINRGNKNNRPRCQRVVVTGLGLITPIGTQIETFWDAAIKGISGICEIRGFDVTGYPCRVAAEVKHFNLNDHFSDQVERLDRCVEFGLAAAKMAIVDSGLESQRENENRIGVCIGSGMGGIMMGERQLVAFYAAGAQRKAHPALIPSVMANALAGQISIRFSAKGPCLTYSTACSSSAHAIGQAFNLIRWGQADVVIAGGAEACISPIVFSGFCSLRVLSTRHNTAPSKASRPFDQERDGFVLGEGAGILILESLEHAAQRSARIYGEVAGYGATSEAYHMVIPEPRGKEAARTIGLALLDAGLAPQDIDYVNAHATSTRIGDIVEAKAIREVFGDRASSIPVSATKSLIGHTIGAAGAIASIVCLLTIERRTIHPTINLEKKDPLCRLGIISGQAIEKTVNVALVNAFGFGSNNSSLIFKAI